MLAAVDLVKELLRIVVCVEQLASREMACWFFLLPDRHESKGGGSCPAKRGGNSGRCNIYIQIKTHSTSDEEKPLAPVYARGFTRATNAFRWRGGRSEAKTDAQRRACTEGEEGGSEMGLKKIDCAGGDGRL